MKQARSCSVIDIISLIIGEVGDGLTDRLATHSMPSDWASHKDEGLQQTSKKEIRALKEEVNQFNFRNFFYQFLVACQN